MAFVEKSLFTTYKFNASGSSSSQMTDSDVEIPTFSISLPSLIEVLQMLGITDSKSQNAFHRDAFNFAPFSNQALGFSSGVCRLLYESSGAPLTIILEEQGITTTCDLTTYQPRYKDDIPFARDQLALKVIMRSSHLHDAIAELGSQNPKALTIRADKDSLTLITASDIGTAQISFSRAAPLPHEHAHVLTSNDDGDDVPARGSPSGLLETYLVPRRFAQSYKFSHVAAAKRAMAAAAKVSIRADEQGVMSLQFMIENEDGGGSGGSGNGGVSFVDFRFVPLVPDDGDENEEDGGGGETDTE